MRKSPRTAPLTDAELLVVAGVATREGWADTGRPPEVASGHPRSLDEARLVERYCAAAAASEARSGRRVWPRLAVAAGTLTVLGVCWWVSPARTAIAVLGAAFFCTVAMRRRTRRGRHRALPGR